jgi:hypothetical protein
MDKNTHAPSLGPGGSACLAARREEEEQLNDQLFADEEWLEDYDGWILD